MTQKNKSNRIVNQEKALKKIRIVIKKHSKNNSLVKELKKLRQEDNSK